MTKVGNVHTTMKTMLVAYTQRIVKDLVTNAAVLQDGSGHVLPYPPS